MKDIDGTDGNVPIKLYLILDKLFVTGDRSQITMY